MSARGRVVRAVLATVFALAIVSPPARADGFEWNRLQGHLSFGYGRLMVGHAPAGSIGVTVGFEHPVRPGLDAGIDLGLYLYGNRTVDRGTLNATLDYSSQEVVFFTHWAVPLGPLSRVSIGPGFTHARTELSSAAGGAQFLDLAKDEVAPSLALDLSMLRRKVAPVRVAMVAGYRVAFVDGPDWNQFSVRVGFHY
jgi:hypothetical protein